MSCTLHEERQVLVQLTDEVGTPFAAKARRLLDASDWVGLASLKVSPTKYRSAEHYLRDAQVAAFLKKSEALPVSEHAQARAVEDFFKAETLCYWSNERLNPLLTDLGHYGEGVRQFFSAWRKEVKRVLRACPSKDELEGRFGPGSTYLNRGDEITIAHKLSDNYSSTPRALNTFSSVWDKTAWSRYAASSLTVVETDYWVSHQSGYELYADNLGYSTRDFSLVSGNRFTTVHKDALRKRGIAVEPSLNVFYQLALGQVIEKRLGSAYQWYKSDIQQYHREMARLGSLHNSNATIDLSMASDTVCKILVKILLPRAWYDFLYQLRSPTTVVNGRTVRLEKFSSMGNGFTFELETLLFYSLCKTLQRLTGVCENVSTGAVVSCFGDDIIVPRELAKDVSAILAFCGFVPNAEKTFYDGPFRESCGGDFFEGKDVRPHFQKAPLDTPERIIACVNGLQRYRDRISGLGRFTDQHRYIPWLINRLPRPIRRLRGPPELGDLVIREDDPWRWSTRTRNSIRYFSVWRPIHNRPHEVEVDYRPGVAHAVALYRAGNGTVSTLDSLQTSTMRRSGLVPRIGGEYVRGYKIGRVPLS